MVLPGHFEGVHQGADVDMPGHLGIPFADGRKKRDEVEDGVDVVPGDDGGHGGGIQGIEHLEGTVSREGFAFADIGGNDIAGAVYSTQIACQFGPDLSSGADDEYFFHDKELINKIRSVHRTISGLEASKGTNKT